MFFMWDIDRPESGTLRGHETGRDETREQQALLEQDTVKLNKCLHRKRTVQSVWEVRVVHRMENGTNPGRT